MLGSFLIFLREGVEGSMLVSIMCAYLAAAGRRDLFRPVFAGVGTALLASAVGGAAMYVLVKDAFVGSAAQTWFETATFLLAVVVLTGMTFWMQRHARRMSATLKAQTATAVGGGSALALATLAFVTVGREAVETTIFLLAIAFRDSPLALLLGAAAGLAVSLALSVAIYRLGVRLNLRRFFAAVGGALLVVAAGLLANAVQNLQELGALPGAGQALWDTGRVLPDESALGDVLHGLVGYTAAPTALQFAAWLVFLGASRAALLGRSSRAAPRAPTQPARG
jgi:high-affinity iron transporter